MSTITTLTLDGTLRFPANSLLSLASQTVRLLHAHYTQQHQTSSDEDAEDECVANLTDVEITLQELDPVYWKELADRRLQSGFTSWTSTELARRADPQTRTSVLLELARIPKAFWVVPQAVKHWRESRGASVDPTEKESEDAQLDLLIFLSEKRERAGLFELMTVDDRA